jgi:hypothetical protein
MGGSLAYLINGKWWEKILKGDISIFFYFYFSFLSKEKCKYFGV